MSSSATQASATQKLLDHIRSTPQKDAPELIPPLIEPAPAPRRSLLRGERCIVGIDVSHGKICLAQRRSGSTPFLEALRVIDAPDIDDWNSPGCVLKVREALDAFLPGKWLSAQIWIHLPEEQAELRHYRIPKVAPKDRDAVAKMTASREKAFDENASIFDYRVGNEVLDKGVPRQPITAMIASRDVTEDLRQRLAASGIVPTGITASTICLQNLFASGWLSSPWEHFAVAEIDEDCTRLDIFSGSTIALSRTIKTGLRSLVTALQETAVSPPPASGSVKPPLSPAAQPPVAAPPQHLPMDDLPLSLTRPIISSPSEPIHLAPVDPLTAPIDPEAAVTPPILIPDDSLGYEEAMDQICSRKHRSPEEEASLLQRLSQPLGRLARQLERTADHFRNAMGMPSVQGVIVFAPGGCLSLALKKFEETLGIPCHPLRFDGQAASGAATDLARALDQKADANLLQAIGLSLSGAAYTPNAVMTYLDRHLGERRSHIIMLSFGITTVALAGLLGFCGKLYSDYQQARHVRTQLEEKLAATGTSYTPDQLKASLADMQKLQNQARNLARRRIAAALISELSLSAPDTVHLTGLRITFKNVAPDKQRSPQRGTGQKNGEPEESAVAVLTGSVTGDMLQRESRLAEFLSQMEHSPMVQSMLVEKQQTDTDILTFVATLRLV